MGCPIIIGENMDLWLSNSMTYAFCDVLTAVAMLEGNDIMAIYEDAPGVAGTYGAGGVGIELDEFHAYLGGAAGLRAHLDVCRARLSEVADACHLSPVGVQNMDHVIAWAAHIMDGGSAPEGTSFYEEWPPVISRRRNTW